MTHSAEKDVPECGAQISTAYPTVSLTCALPVLHDGPHSNEYPAGAHHLNTCVQCRDWGKYERHEDHAEVPRGGHNA